MAIQTAGETETIQIQLSLTITYQKLGRLSGEYGVSRYTRCARTLPDLAVGCFATFILYDITNSILEHNLHIRNLLALDDVRGSWTFNHTNLVEK